MLYQRYSGSQARPCETLSRSGMLLSTISTRCIADLISTGKSPVSLAAFDPARFTPTLQASL